MRLLKNSHFSVQRAERNAGGGDDRFRAAAGEKRTVLTAGGSRKATSQRLFLLSSWPLLNGAARRQERSECGPLARHFVPVCAGRVSRRRNRTRRARARAGHGRERRLSDGRECESLAVKPITNSTAERKERDILRSILPPNTSRSSRLC